MVKLTIVGRVSDGMPLAQGPRHTSEENENVLFYKQQGELILREVSKGTISPSKMSISIDHHCFHYLIENGVCYITLCDSSYPRKLAFHYLQDLQKEFQKVDIKLVETVSKPYAFNRFDYVIGNIRKQYIDTRTQANLSKLNANRRQDLDIITEDISKVISNGQESDVPQSSSPVSRMESSIWTSQYLEVIALKWTPISILVFVAATLLWTSLVLTDYYVIPAS